MRRDRWEITLRIGVVDLGRMGGNIARRLTRAGHDCVVFDVDANARATLVEAGAEEAALFARFRSRKDHTFADKLLSAMWKEFGGHLEPNRGTTT